MIISNIKTHGSHLQLNALFDIFHYFQTHQDTNKKKTSHETDVHNSISLGRIIICPTYTDKIKTFRETDVIQKFYKVR